MDLSSFLPYSAHLILIDVITLTLLIMHYALRSRYLLRLSNVDTTEMILQLFSGLKGSIVWRAKMKERKTRPC